MGLETLSDVELILLILAAFYLAECCAWVRGTVVGFSSPWRRFRPLRRSEWLGNPQSGLLMTHPLPWATAFLCEPWPGVVDAEGFWPAEPVGDRFPERIPFERLRELAVQDRQVCLNGRPAVWAASADHARSLAGNLKKLAAAPAGDRSRLLDTLLGEATNPDGVRNRLDQVRCATASLRHWCISLFALIFLVGPLLYYFSPTASGSLRLWVYLGLCGAYWALILISFRAAHRSLFPEAAGERRKRLLMMLCSPAGAVRSAETVARGALAGFHPLAVAAVVCSRAGFEALARQTLRELRYPLPLVGDDSSRDAAERMFRRVLLGHLENLVRTAGFDPDALTAAPAADPDARSYCPRCETQYVSAEGTCERCAGLTCLTFSSERAACTS